jgi:uncharacterized membrane protein HdeD (DUF308 family)
MATLARSEPVDQSARRAYQVLRITFIVLPIVTGVDQFLNKLTSWDMYLAPFATRVLPLSSHAIMGIAGVVEIAAGLLVAFRPRWGAWIVAAWLFAITINLVISGNFYDIALRDLALTAAAVALALLAR